MLLSVRCVCGIFVDAFVGLIVRLFIFKCSAHTAGLVVYFRRGRREERRGTREEGGVRRRGLREEGGGRREEEGRGRGEGREDAT